MPALSSRWSRWTPSFDRAAAVMGLQMAIGLVAVLFFALVLRLEHPTWSVFTVLMLLMARYVGAVQEKAVFRVAGTIAGGALGYLATGALQQDPWLYLTVTFVVLAVSVAMFGQSRAPYAFFLTGLTFVVVVSNSQTNPENAWQAALWRVEEVGLGVVVSLVVQTTVFPSYANRSFREALKSTLDELKTATPLGVRHFSEAHTGLAQSLADFPGRSATLRSLLRFGGMESRDFRTEIGRYAELIDKVSRGASLLRSFQRYEPAPEPYRSAVKEVVSRLGVLLASGWEGLHTNGCLPAEWRSDAEKLFAQLDEGLLSLRGSQEAAQVPPGGWMALSAHLLALSELRDVLIQIDDIERAPAGSLGAEDRMALAPAWPGPEWIFRGLRSALGCVIALVLENWLDMPGGALMLLCVYTFTALNAQSPDETGDQTAMRYSVFFGVGAIGLCVALLAATPLMASYAVLNILMAAWAFLFGYWFVGSGGVTVPITASFMMLVSVVGLNAQKPVAFVDIVGLFNGLILGFVLSALIQRLFWPVLPQKNLQRGVCDFAQVLKESVEAGMDRLPLWKRTAHGLFPAKARKLIGVMAGPSLPPEEAARLGRFVQTLQDLGGELALCVGRLRPLLPHDLDAEVGESIADSKAIFLDGLGALETSFRRGARPADLTLEIERGLGLCDEWYQRIHAHVLANDVAPAKAIVFLGLGARFRAALLLLQKALGEARELHLTDYLGDVSL